ncbi:hypothetical protein MSG28_014346 [Choristoneura fumiferana]|uniref:Uncharacterized protein n=1 Tax=Choristoneura fumiferana TaxID=7141 RepID=A0ACC0JGX6_CHOFU|nr:hypothetical protein MSG28_014346 [Choristoneura fumiferana]
MGDELSVVRPCESSGSPRTQRAGQDDGKRPDGMSLVPWSMGRPLVWDATCVDTLAPSHVPSTSVTAGAAASSAESLKRRKYAALGTSYMFAHFGVETLGPWGPSARRLYKDLSTRLMEARATRGLATISHSIAIVTRWTDDLVKAAGSRWTQAADNRSNWRKERTPTLKAGNALVTLLVLQVFMGDVKFASGRYIPARRQESDPTPDEPLNEEQILYDNMNILRDLTLTTESIWDFEEVNYDEMIGAIKDEHNDCFGITGSSSDPGNFRPISVLPVLSKVFEKIMLNQLLRHFNVNNLLHSQQFGFTKGRSTTDAAASLMKYIYDAWENSQDAIGIFCDLSKAFDCVEHETLIRKLQHYGLSAKALNLVKSYLSQRIQKVDINRTQSAGSAVKLGVPQGSILGPFLFLVYINDLPHLLEQKCNIVLFADDTSLIFKVNRQQEDPTHINETLAEALNWFTANNLLLNAAKTNIMSYGMLIWGKAADIETIFILQKRAVRSIYNLGSRDSLRERFKEINILTVASQYIHDARDVEAPKTIP